MADTPQAADQPSPPVTAAARYAALEPERSGVLQRAREASALTVPSLIPPEGTTDTTQLPQPFQSVGARGVNNLAAKLLLVLFPPGSNFFRLDVDEFVLDALKEKAKAAGAADPTADIDTSLSKVEKGITKKLEETNFRSTMIECLKHLIVAGNGLLQTLKSGVVKFHSLVNYVCKRDSTGEPVEIVVREGLSKATLPAEALAIVTQQQNPQTPTGTGVNTDLIWVYTWIRLKTNIQGARFWITHQEVCGTKIPGTDGQYPVDASAFLALRWEKVSGSDYGRGHVEQYIGDHWSLENLSKAIVEGSAAAAKMLWMVDEGGTTQKRTIARAPNNAVVDGNAKDVTVLKAEKLADFSVAKSTADDIKQRLEQCYLQTSSIQRNAERVTAEEIRIMAGELESALGGTYSLLGGELQRPLVIRIMAVMTRARQLPAFPKGVVNPTIIAGLDGLGRSNDLMKLDQLFQGAEALFGAPAVAEYANVGAYIKRRGAALGIDTTGVIRSDDEVNQARQAAAQQAILQKTAPAGIKAMSDQALAARQDQGPPQPQ